MRSAICIFLLCARVFTSNGQAINIQLSPKAPPREKYGAERLETALKAAGYRTGATDASIHINISVRPGITGKESFTLIRHGNRIDITGEDPSGVLYGCLALADSIQTSGKLPASLSVTDHPEMPFRATCIGLQKPYYLPGRTAYEYPYTPGTFPWLYDKQLWIKYLDMLVADRMNALCLWNGHPFASLVRVKEYPYAVEVPDSTLQKNREIFEFLAREADKRGIWIVQSFYNIIVSKPFAEYHHIKTQDRERHIVPLIADYTRKSIAAFVAEYPNVGLMVTLGEAMEGVGPDDVEWLTKTIIPGIKDGLAKNGKKEEPPLILRAHDTDAPADMKAALPLYKNLYTEAKYNGEALTTYTPHGPWAELHRTLSKSGTVQIENVHILANLEPFRYGSDDFIQKCVQAMHETYLAKGLHLYPQASYWDWPYSADSVSTNGAPNGRLLEMDRDWIWYKEWARYAWNYHRDRASEVSYWSGQLASMYGCDTTHARDILEAYEQSGEISPKLLRRYGITDGNRQTMTLGMFMNQLIDPYKFGLFDLLYNSEGPEGEMLIQYAEKEWKHEPHTGETPVQVAAEVRIEGKAAVEAIDKAAGAVTTNRDEFERLRNDMYCYNAMANFYADKATAAIHVLRYKYSNDVKDLEDALPLLRSSVEHYKELVNLTKGTYLYANSMQTGQRKIPIRGANAKYKTWVEMLPLYEKELKAFEHNVDSLKTAPPGIRIISGVPFPNAPVILLSGAAGSYTIGAGAQPFADTALSIKAWAPELEGLKGVQILRSAETNITFTCDAPVKVLVGYFVTKIPGYLREPELETNASANDYGQADIRIGSAVQLPDQPSVNIHTFSFPAGKNTLSLGKGACLVLGFIPEGQTIRNYNAGLNEPGARDIDWLFENLP